jgi:peptidoglycan/xylan/chitin deacetylase (PgdA/CDA1 family)
MPNLVDRAVGTAQHHDAAPAARVPILMYHQITAEPMSDRRLTVHPDNFARQLRYLHGCGYRTLTAAQLAGALTSGGGELPAKPVVLTFDDGFGDFYEVALPLLARYDFTGTVFVTTGWIGTNGPNMLTWRQVDAVAAAGVEIGAHSVTHPQLDQLADDRLRNEMAAAKAALQDRLGARVTGLAYPFGYCDMRVRAAAAEAGYEYACAVRNRLADASADQFALPRLTIGQSTTLPSFARIVAAERLPAEFAGYRALTMGWSAVRHARHALRRLAR